MNELILSYKNLSEIDLDMSKLTILDLSNNKISKIKNLDKLSSLLTLDLGNNNISKIENLDKLSNLKELWLDDNVKFISKKSYDLLKKNNTKINDYPYNNIDLFMKYNCIEFTREDLLNKMLNE